MTDNHSNSAENGTLAALGRDIWVYGAPCVIVQGVLCNIVCIIVLRTPCFQRSTTGFLLTCLAWVDISCLCLGASHLWIKQYTGTDIREQSATVCKLHIFTTYLCPHLSSWTLVFVTLERCLAVIFPLRVAAWVTMQRVVFAWFIMAAISAVSWSYLLILTELLPLDLLDSMNYNYTYDYYEYNYTQDYQPIYSDNTSSLQCRMNTYNLTSFRNWQAFIMLSGLPMILIITSNAIILWKLLAPSKLCRNRFTGGHNRSLSIMLISVSVVYLVTALPIDIYLLGQMDGMFIEENEDLTEIGDFIFNVLQLIYYLNNSLNFFLYYLSGSRFRRALRGLVWKKEEYGTLREHMSSPIPHSIFISKLERSSKLRHWRF